MSQDFINIIIGVSGAMAGWIMKVLWDSVKTIQKDIKDFEKELHLSYVSKDDFRQDIQEVKDILNKIFDKLDQKADK